MFYLPKDFFRRVKSHGAKRTARMIPATAATITEILLKVVPVYVPTAAKKAELEAAEINSIRKND